MSNALNENFNENQVKALGAAKKGVAVADAAVPFASLTTAADKMNELLASLRDAGLLAE